MASILAVSTQNEQFSQQHRPHLMVYAPNMLQLSSLNLLSSLAGREQLKHSQQQFLRPQTLAISEKNRIFVVFRLTYDRCLFSLCLESVTHSLAPVYAARFWLKSSGYARYFYSHGLCTDG